MCAINSAVRTHSIAHMTYGARPEDWCIMLRIFRLAKHTPSFGAGSSPHRLAMRLTVPRRAHALATRNSPPSQRVSLGPLRTCMQLHRAHCPAVRAALQPPLRGILQPRKNSSERFAPAHAPSFGRGGDSRGRAGVRLPRTVRPQAAVPAHRPRSTSIDVRLPESVSVAAARQQVCKAWSETKAASAASSADEARRCCRRTAPALSLPCMREAAVGACVRVRRDRDVRERRPR